VWPDDIRTHAASARGALNVCGHGAGIHRDACESLLLKLRMAIREATASPDHVPEASLN